jgi:hypothetical protein
MSNDKTINADANLSRETMLELGKRRPFKTFITFPLEIRDVTYSYPENGDYTEDVSKTPILTINKPKETYISPFTGRVM